ncbi:MAG: arsenate reductase ArsC [Terrimicrobiaceae bacterium]
MPHPLALEVLRRDFKIDASDSYSKPWEEFKDVQFDFVITLCDNAKETCPIWPGQPIVAHWSSPDPAAVEGSKAEKRRAFWQVAQQIKRRLELLASLPFEKLDALRLEAATREIGIDISRHTSKHMNEYLNRRVDTVITVCGNADQACPMFPGQVNRYHWGFDDPAHAKGTEDQIYSEFRRVRDQIKLVFEAYAAGLREGAKRNAAL